MKTTHALPLALCATLLLAPLSAPAQSGKPGLVLSDRKPGGALPTDWKNLPVAEGKARTEYQLVAEDGRTVLRAQANGSASALMHAGDVDLSRTPVVAWRWKADGAIPGADNRDGAREDAPARLVFFFDGDTSKLSLGERAAMQLARTVAGEELPYATLMYVWSTSAAPGSVIPNPHTGRVQMIVVSGADDAGKWQNLRRNLARDYERVFHEPPGPLKAYGIMTDTDNTHAATRAWYGDIRFLPGTPAKD
ncbi:DUF3047 domain-containing protein [Cupriavidus sp. WGlv3]|uniref:DUF3047 domain-containing protein n=1 Tax=Cupriavidus sp. WGlv3 TaxID=2919924 RepID=UPI002090B12A|nr:DUF3047 domain-containing protein [Cupriavidus sp. WGlv3]MCO4864502.1 DUF3047 domain-containing protein [Cupriavidus sp. WGlv3]